MRPRPRLTTGTNPAIKTSKQAGRVKAVGNLLGDSPKIVPDQLATGAKDAQRQNALRARAKAAQLDILAKRRTDEGER